MNALPPADVPNASDLYEGVDYPLYWEGAARQKLDALERVLVRQLLPEHGQRIIDIGCGYGRLLDCYVDRFEQIVLFDGSESLLRQARSAAPANALYVLGDIEHLPFQPAAFSVALMVRVFHHLNRPKSCLEGVQSILCGGGTLVMNYSNKRNAFRVMQFLLRRNSHNPFILEPLTMEANFFHHHPAWISQILSSSDFGKPIYRGAGVLDKLAAIAGPLAKMLPRGTLLAPFLGSTALAPWIFCKVETQKHDAILPVTRVEDLLACPLCKGTLNRKTSGYECRQCQRIYSRRNGIADMRLN